MTALLDLATTIAALLPPPPSEAVRLAGASVRAMASLERAHKAWRDTGPKRKAGRARRLRVAVWTAKAALGLSPIAGAETRVATIAGEVGL